MKDSEAHFTLGACLGSDPSVFVPLAGENAKVKLAKETCRTCAYRLPCLEWALAHYSDGIWGGTSGRERDQIRRQRIGRAG